MNTYPMYEQITEIRRKLQKKLDPMRYEHTLSVSFTCMNLAMNYGYDLQKAELAGLLHDCAKHFTDEELIARCEKHGIPLTEGQIKAPAVIHAIYGAWLAEHKYGLEDPEILEAIRCHTTGKPAMSMLEKILYIADFIEPRRDKAPSLPAVRALAFQDLNQTVYEIMDGTLHYLKQEGSCVDPMTEEAYQYYQKLAEAKTAQETKTSSQTKQESSFKKGDAENGTGKRNDKAGYKRPGRQKRRGCKGH